MRGLAADSPSSYLAEAASVLDVSNHSGFTFLTSQIEHRAEALDQQQRQDLRAYGQGKDLNQAEYCRREGEIEGLRSLAEIVQTVLLIAEQVEEKQEQAAAKLAAVGS